MILITGGAGLIGRALALRFDPQELVIADHRRPSVDCASFVPASELFLDEHQGLFQNLRLIFHLGACSSTTETRMAYLMENNVCYSARLFHLAGAHNIPFIYASSAATYGHLPPGAPWDDAHQHLPSLRPVNPYGWSKHLFDLWAVQHPGPPAHWFGLKFFNVFGPTEGHKGEMASMVFQGYHQILATGKIRLFQCDPPPVRDFIYVEDVVDGMVALSQLRPKEGQSGIYNLGTGVERSFDDLALGLFQAMGIRPDIQRVAMPEKLKAHYQYFTRASMKKWKQILPDFSFLGLEEATARCVAQMKGL